MKTEMAPRPLPSAALDCPWCGEPVEADDDSPTLRCPGCRVQVAFAPDERDRGQDRRLAETRPAA